MTPNPFRRLHGAPIVYGHRGARGVLPENTLASFRYLRDTGAEGLEIDVQNAAGQVPVVVHDPFVPMQLARGPDGEWLRAVGPKIRDLSLTQLQVYDVGRLNPHHCYGKPYPDQQARDGERIPSLEEVLDWATGEDRLILNIEIKSYATRDDMGDSPAMLVESLLQALAHHRLPSEVLVSSFDWRVLDELQRLAPDLARGYLTYEQPGEHLTVFEGSPWMAGLSLTQHADSLPGLIAAQGGRCWCAYHRDLTEARIRQAHELGLAVNAWTVNNPDDIARMVAWGIDGIITDYPARVARHGSLSTG
jgi:glycerophosphoryl diester phosphodiesterase